MTDINDWSEPGDDWEPDYGRGRIRYRDDRFRISYKSEAEARSGLAALAHACGWLVQEEVVVPGWGRIDLVLRETHEAGPILIELKVDLIRPRDIRKACQQADGYGRWWARVRGEVNLPLLVGCNVDEAAAAPVADTYPEVWICAASPFMNWLQTGGQPHNRLARAMERAAALRQRLAVHDEAVNNLYAAAAMKNCTDKGGNQPALFDGLPVGIVIAPGAIKPRGRCTWADFEIGRGERVANIDHAKDRLTRYDAAMDRLRGLMSANPTLTADEAAELLLQGTAND